MAEHPSFSQPGVPTGEPVEGRTYRADGWAFFRTSGRYTAETWAQLITTVGEDNFVPLSISEEFEEGRKLVQGEFLLSPEGVSRLDAERMAKAG